MSNQYSLESYIVERIKKLETEVELLQQERDGMAKELKRVADIKLKMQRYFELKQFVGGVYYIDHSYSGNQDDVKDIASFMMILDLDQSEQEESNE